MQRCYSFTMTTSPRTTHDTIRGAFTQARTLLDVVLGDDAMLAGLAGFADAISSSINAGNKVLICGNGGSLCDAAHFAEELTGRFRHDRRPLPAIACTEPGHLTCTANDYGFEQVFARWVTALGRSGDCLVILSTSGNSPNCLRAAEAGRAAGMTVLALLGKDGGTLRGVCDTALVMPGDTSDRIQELHMLALHATVEIIEQRLAAIAPRPS